MFANEIQSNVEAVLGFFYPQLCVGCEENTAPNKEILCLSCQFNIPQTDYHLRKDNPLTERLFGRFPIESGAAYYLFSKSGHTQSLIHAIKYEGKKEIASIIGEQYGDKLKDSPYFCNIDAIVPVPMHPVKERTRGYNQAEVFAMGLAHSLGKPMQHKVLKKVRKTNSQTKKSRFARLENVVEVFKLTANSKLLEGKHILLVDDVLTTGATIEACANELLQIKNIKLSIATIAMATNI